MKKIVTLASVFSVLLLGAPALASPAVQAAETPRVDACPTGIPSVRWGGWVMIPCQAVDMRGF